ncbi:TolB family protein [Tautonia plasticadhaerens]|uniref:Translocation protein TolB n=1 Tax=Tautonia plasticadhaerens TaxID=2527974 RepID=A0A518H2G3_9BACT|nr:PD40 domain-containing protein [Tautonia plasticadhaerens]QDV35049.1 translocation protein TolB [Tautonia plasticadhaerens]
MLDRFGPWSSALGDGHSQRLSTFWRRRMLMLAPTRSAPTAPSRRDWLALGVSCVAAAALPTLLLATPEPPAASQDDGPGTIYVQAIAQVDSDAFRVQIAGVYAIDPEAETRERVTDLYGSVRASRDGRMLALSRSGWSGKDLATEIDNPGVWILDAEGEGEPRRLSKFGGVMSWSPDGSELIVSKWRPESSDDGPRREAWRFEVDGSDATKLPIPETEEVNDWSLDGKWLVTVSDRDHPDSTGYQLYLMRPDGTEQRRLTEGNGLNVYPRFSPDGRQIAYLHSEGGEASIWVIDVDGSDRRQVFREQGDDAPGQLCWSPDGRSLAVAMHTWSRDEDGQKYIGVTEDANYRVAIIDLEAGGIRTLDLPPTSWLGGPDWR